MLAAAMLFLKNVSYCEHFENILVYLPNENRTNAYSERTKLLVVALVYIK